MIWYFFTKVKTNIQKNRKERLNRKRKRTYLSPRRSQPTPAQPAHRGRGVFFPTPRPQAARWNATALVGDATSSPRSFQASPSLLLTPGCALEHDSSIPPLQSFLLLLPCSFPSPPENSPEHQSAPVWPSTPRSPSKLSSVIAVLVFVD